MAMGIDYFFEEQRILIARLSEVRRYLYRHIHRNQRCIGILGARGTGKTTLILQHIKEQYASQTEKALYISVCFSN